MHAWGKGEMFSKVYRQIQRQRAKGVVGGGRQVWE